MQCQNRSRTVIGPFQLSVSTIQTEQFAINSMYNHYATTCTGYRKNFAAHKRTPTLFASRHIQRQYFGIAGTQQNHTQPQTRAARQFQIGINTPDLATIGGVQCFYSTFSICDKDLAFVDQRNQFGPLISTGTDRAFPDNLRFKFIHQLSQFGWFLGIINVAEPERATTGQRQTQQ